MGSGIGVLESTPRHLNSILELQQLDRKDAYDIDSR